MNSGEEAFASTTDATASTRTNVTPDENEIQRKVYFAVTYFSSDSNCILPSVWATLAQLLELWQHNKTDILLGGGRLLSTFIHRHKKLINYNIN